MNFQEVEAHLLQKPGAKLDYPFGEDTAVYKVGGKMFALMQEKKEPLRISLKCDPLLAETLRDRYEEVTAGYHLNKKHWNTIIVTGQLRADEIYDLINLSYDLVFSSLTNEEKTTITLHQSLDDSR